MFVRMSATDLIDLILPPEDPSWTPPPNPPDMPPDLFIVMLPTIDYPPNTPSVRNSYRLLTGCALGEKPM